jgi:hypothetical protein
MPTTTTRVVVPVELAELFQAQADETLQLALCELEGNLRRLASSDVDVDRHWLRANLPQDREWVAAAQELQAQATEQSGALLVDGDARAIAETLEGCILEVADEIQTLSEAHGGAQRFPALRTAIGRLERYIALAEQLHADVAAV